MVGAGPWLGCEGQRLWIKCRRDRIREARPRAGSFEAGGRGGARVRCSGRGTRHSPLAFASPAPSLTDAGCLPGWTTWRIGGRAGRQRAGGERGGTRCRGRHGLLHQAPHRTVRSRIRPPCVTACVAARTRPLASGPCAFAAREPRSLRPRAVRLLTPLPIGRARGASTHNNGCPTTRGGPNSRPQSRWP